jgi:hypothetical protein
MGAEFAFGHAQILSGCERSKRRSTAEAAVGRKKGDKLAWVELIKRKVAES